MKREIRMLEDYLPPISETLKKWDTIYRKVYLLRYLHIKRVISSKKSFTILDAGCGDGMLLSTLYDLCEEGTYVGIDFSFKKLAKAHSKFKHFKNIHFVLSDIEHIPLRRSCMDIVIFCDILEHVMKEDLALYESNRIIKPNGRFVVSVPAAYRLLTTSPETYRVKIMSIFTILKNLILCVIDRPPSEREYFLQKANKSLPHRDYTRFELKSLLQGHFKDIKLKSFSFNHIYLILKVILPSSLTAKLIHYIDLAIFKIPFLCLMGDYLIAFN